MTGLNANPPEGKNGATNDKWNVLDSHRLKRQWTGHLVKTTDNLFLENIVRFSSN